MQDNDAMDDTVEQRMSSADLSRRQFGVLTFGAGLASVLPTVANTAQNKDHASTVPSSRNIELYRRLIERGFNQGDLTVADEIGGQKYLSHEYLASNGIPGPEVLKIQIRETRKAVQQFSLTIEDFVESGDKLWLRQTVRGIESRSGKPFVMDAIDICRFENGKIVEHWGVPDRFALLHQVGRLPPDVA